MRNTLALRLARTVAAVVAFEVPQTAAVSSGRQFGVLIPQSQRKWSEAFAYRQQRHDHCACKGTLGAEVAMKVVVQYDPEEVDSFIALADAIEDVYPEVIVEGNPDGDPTTGTFHVTTTTGDVLFARAARSELPEHQTIIEKLASLL